MTSLDALRRFNTEAPEAPGETLAFQMPERVPWVMSFDQSLLHTGMVVLHGRGTVEATTLRPPPGMGKVTNILDAYAMEDWLERTISNRVAEMMSVWGRGVVLLERPPDKKMMRTESSILAGLAVVRSARKMSVPFQVIARQTAYARVYGHGNAKKKDAHDWLDKRMPPEWGVTNEHERDALMIALAHLKGER